MWVGQAASTGGSNMTRLIARIGFTRLSSAAADMTFVIPGFLDEFDDPDRQHLLRDQEFRREAVARTVIDWSFTARVRC